MPDYKGLYTQYLRLLDELPFSLPDYASKVPSLEEFTLAWDQLPEAQRAWFERAFRNGYTKAADEDRQGMMAVMDGFSKP